MPRTKRAFWAFVSSDHGIIMRYWRKEGELGPWAVQQEYQDNSTSPPPSIACLLDSSQVCIPTGLQTYITLRCYLTERSYLTSASEGVESTASI